MCMYGEDGWWCDGYFDFIGGSIMLPVWFAAFGDECGEAIGNLGRVR